VNASFSHAEYIREFYGVCHKLRTAGRCQCMKDKLAIELQHQCPHYKRAPVVNNWVEFMEWQGKNR